MEDFQAILTKSPAHSSDSKRAVRENLLRCMVAFGSHLQDGRSRRIALLLATVWLVGLSDLSMTVTARNIGQFKESNPVAASMLHDSALLSAFKLASLVIASAIFLTFRKHWFTEAACWFVFAVHVALAFIWLSYFTHMS